MPDIINQEVTEKLPFVDLLQSGDKISVFEFERELRKFGEKFIVSLTARNKSASSEEITAHLEAQIPTHYNQDQIILLYQIFEKLFNTEQIYDYLAVTRDSHISCYFPAIFTAIKSIIKYYSTFTIDIANNPNININLAEFNDIYQFINQLYEENKVIQDLTITNILSQDIPYDEQYRKYKEYFFCKVLTEKRSLENVVIQLSHSYSNVLENLQRHQIKPEKQILMRAKITDLQTLFSKIRDISETFPHFDLPIDKNLAFFNKNTHLPFKAITEEIDTRIIKLYTVCDDLIRGYQEDSAKINPKSPRKEILQNKIDALTEMKKQLIPTAKASEPTPQALKAHLNASPLEQKYLRIVNFETQLSCNFNTLSKNDDTRFKKALKIIASVIILPSLWFTNSLLNKLWITQGEEKIKEMKNIITPSSQIYQRSH